MKIHGLRYFFCDIINKKEMSDFTPITTQEDFDKAIQKRLAQKDREAEEKYRDYLAPDKVDALKADYDKKISDAAALVKDAQAKLAKHDEEIASITTGSSVD